MSPDELKFLDENARREQIDVLESAVSLDLEEARKREELESIKQDRRERKKFATRIFWVVIAYIAVVFVVLFFCGYSCIYLSDAVLITLLSTTTANILSLLVIVFNYLFPKKIKY